MASYNFFQDNKMMTAKHTNNPERRLWRAVLNQALEDGFGLYTTFMTQYEKLDAQLFVSKRTKAFDEICERADVDANLAWKRIQKFKLLKNNILKASNTREKEALELFNMIKDARFRMNSKRNKKCQS